MILGSDPLAAFARSLAYRVCDLKHIPFADLAPDARPRATMGLLKHSSRGALPQDEGSKILRALAGMPPDGEHLRQLMIYIDDVFKLTPVDLARLWPRGGSGTEKSIMPTLTEHWAEAGRIEGRAEGQATALLRPLEPRFGPVPEAAAARVRAANIGELDDWLDAILNAKTFDDVFENRSLH